MRTVIVQYAGDYREAVRRINAAGEETYYAQRHSVDAVAALATGNDSVIVICCLTDAPYDECLENGVRAIGAGFSAPFDGRRLIPLVAPQNPDRLIVRTPAKHLLRWAASQSFRTLAVFADSFTFGGLRGRIRAYQWKTLLNEKRIEFVLNHGLNSCLSLRKIGVDPDKVIPWDWPAMVTPDAHAKLQPKTECFEILFVGLVTEAKGIGDAIRAIAELKRRGMNVRLRVVGGGEVETFAALAKTLHVDDRVGFSGLLGHDAVLAHMRDAAVVVVPSHHDYAEGFPMTIYDTLCSRTPLVASDHPMFRGNLTHDVDSWIFPAGDANALAEGLCGLLSNEDRYRRLSAASVDTWVRLQLPVKWAEAMERWVSDSADDRNWFRERRLSSGIYPLQRYET